LNVSAFNPELVRKHAHPVAARAGCSPTAVICVAVSLSCAAFYLSSRTVSLAPIDNARNLFQLILTFQIVALLIGGGIYCLQFRASRKKI